MSFGQSDFAGGFLEDADTVSTTSEVLSFWPNQRAQELDDRECAGFATARAGAEVRPPAAQSERLRMGTTSGNPREAGSGADSGRRERAARRPKMNDKTGKASRSVSASVW